MFNSLTARGNKLYLNLDVLLQMLQNLLPEVSMENSPWWGWVGSEEMHWALVRQRLCPMSWMEGRMIFSAVLTTLCRDFQSEALQAPNQTEMQQTLDGASVEANKDGRGEGHS